MNLQEIITAKYSRKMMEENQNTVTKKSEVAVKVMIGTIMTAPFVREQETRRAYIQLNNEQIERVNVIGIVVNKEEDTIRSVIIDDGTGTMRVTIYNEYMFQKLEINQSVIVIGKIRQYGGDLYISAEIVRTIDKRWQEVRRKELSKIERQTVKTDSTMDQEATTSQTAESPPATPEEQMYALIKRIDKGQGAELSAVLAEYNQPDGEGVLQQLKEKGDIFEPQPGRLKVLE